MADEQISEPDPSETAIEWLKSDPYGGDVLDRVSRVTAIINTAFQNNRVAVAVACTAQMIELEEAAPDDSSERYSYSIALQRLLTYDKLKLTSDQPVARTATLLARLGAEGMRRIVAGVRESRGITEALRLLQTIRNADDNHAALLELLDDQAAVVLAAVAQTVGEMGMEAAIPKLAGLVEHEDPRVEQAAVTALAQIDNWAAAAQVKQVLTSHNRKRQSTVTRAIGKRKSQAFVSPLVDLSKESGVDLKLLEECYSALGNIGTNGALKALVEAAQPGGRLIHRKPLAKRLAAIRGLSLMENDTVVEALTALTGDRAESVRVAAEKALETVKTRGS